MKLHIFLPGLQDIQDLPGMSENLPPLSSGARSPSATVGIESRSTNASSALVELSVSVLFCWDYPVPTGS